MAFRVVPISRTGFYGLGQAETSSEFALMAKERELADLKAQRAAVEAEIAVVKGLAPPPGVRAHGAPAAAPTPPPAAPGLPGLPLGLTWGQLAIAGVGLVLYLRRGK